MHRDFVLSITLLCFVPGIVLGQAFDGKPPGPRRGEYELKEPDLTLPPSPNPPSLLEPRNNKVWKCSKCGAVVGTGPTEPKIEKCPTCGAKLTNWFNYYIVGGVGGAVPAGLVIMSLILRAVKPRGPSPPGT